MAKRNRELAFFQKALRDARMMMTVEPPPYDGPVTTATSPGVNFILQYPKSLGLPDGDFHTHLLCAVCFGEKDFRVNAAHRTLLKSNPEYRERYEWALRSIERERIRRNEK